MNKQLLKDSFGWGIMLWLIGYVLGIIFFKLVPPALLGWYIMPIGIIVSLWVLYKKVKSTTLKEFLTIAVAWTALAVVLDYVFLVLLFNPADGYYKLDVYIYYALTFLLPLIVGFMKNGKNK